jgi:2-polyprenyl-3-methyl-5-hydroxy-6-metoxy-1,4-benzoquinol methylase
MPIKANWTEYLHKLRKHQMSIIFADCPAKTFGKTLELGAGDGFVSSILSNYTEKLVCTDLNDNRLTKTDTDNIEYKIVDAEKVGEAFSEQEFNFIFSSSLLEHLPNVEDAIEGMHKVLKDDGVCVHYMPNRLWVLMIVLFHLPNKIAKNIDKLLVKLFGDETTKTAYMKKRKKRVGGNNLKSEKKRQFFLFKPFIPRPHGISDGLIKEFIAFGKNEWIDKFQATGFDILGVKPVSFNSGYGFGYTKFRNILEKKRICTGYTYIVCKKGFKSSYAKVFKIEK